jgi:two-component system, cell cycle response regulator
LAHDPNSSFQHVDDREKTDSFFLDSEKSRARQGKADVFHPILICIHGFHRGARHRFDKSAVTLGRARECDISLSDSGVSRNHAKVTWENIDKPNEPPLCYIEDTGSRNGTEVNGRLIQGKMRLGERDRIVLGRCVFGLFFRDEAELIQDESLYEKATRDALTGLENRQQFVSHLRLYKARAIRDKAPLCLLVVDADHFKSINDTFGHATGDDALRHISQLLRETLRIGDVVGRWGGEEFVIALPATAPDAGIQLADRLRETIAKAPVYRDKEQPVVTVSIGIAELEGDETTDSLFRRADKALYLAKERGRNRVVFLKAAEDTGEAARTRS